MISLSGDINEYGFDTTSTDVVKSAGSIMAQLVEHISAGKPEDVTVIDYKAREKGKRHVKDIVPTTMEYRDGKFDIKGEIITIDMSSYSEKETDQILRYVQALYEAYESRLKRRIDASNVDTMPEEMRENYTEQNRAFYYADSIRHNIEEMFYEGEDEFRKLKDNEWMFIRRTYRRPYDDGFERLEAVLDRAMESDLSSSILANIRNLIDNLAYYTYRDHYVQFEELPGGEGFADVVYFPRHDSDWPTLVIELKWNKSARGAIDQILNKKYANVAENFGTDILLVGVNYEKDAPPGKRKHTCSIVRYEVK